ncbi:MAG: hypothetical protein ACLVHV_15645 [Oscillospiraceae bacterium]
MRSVFETPVTCRKCTEPRNAKSSMTSPRTRGKCRKISIEGMVGLSRRLFDASPAAVDTLQKVVKTVPLLPIGG